MEKGNATNVANSSHVIVIGIVIVKSAVMGKSKIIFYSITHTHTNLYIVKIKKQRKKRKM